MEPDKSSQNSAPGTADMERSPFLHEPTSHLGPITGVLIVVLILILGGLYLWGSALIEEPEPQPQATAKVADEPKPASVESLSTVSVSDELEAIGQDITDTNLTALDAEFELIKEELEQRQ